MKGVDDLDFYIGDEAVDKPTYSTKVTKSMMAPHTLTVWKTNYCFISLFLQETDECAHPKKIQPFTGKIIYC